MTEDARARAVLDACRARGWMLSTAESCTGGLISAALTAVPGSSEVFERGFVTYSYPSKMELLCVPQAMLDKHGAVSEPVVRQMAAGALAASRAQVSVAVTGVAGPGGSDSKPEGLVWFATATQSGVKTLRRHFGRPGRATVRARSVETALDLVLQTLAEVP